MKTKKLLLLCAMGMSAYLLAQKPTTYSLSTISDARQADEQKAREFFVQYNFNMKDYDEYITSWRKTYSDNSLQEKALPASPASPMAACTNADFELGSLTGWNSSTGYHPLYNPIGCCTTMGGAQAITSGGGVDPFGLFPVVCAGGNNSLKLGNAAVNGIADRIEQTFMVTNSNSNYSYKYAVVLEDPGHTQAQQPAFTIEMIDSAGNQIPCTYYDVTAGQGIPGFQASTVQSDVIFKPWTTVAVNLTGYIGQNVTIRFTTYDCALGGHFGYAYIDGSCQSFQITLNHSLCSNSTAQICAPAGFAAYNWTGTGIISGGNTACATINAGGNYSVQLTTVTGCTSPISFNVATIPAPVASFTTTNQTCNNQLAFTNVSSGFGLSSVWNFGDGGTSSIYSPSHTYAGSGTYPASMIVYSLNGCSDTTMQNVTVFPKPNAQFLFNTACATNTVNFTNNSSVSGGTITNNKWAFGDGTSSLVLNPIHVYYNSGNYNVQLIVTDNNTCKDSLIKIETIYNLPIAIFSAQAVCPGSTTNFNNSSTVIGSTLSSYNWDFTTDGTFDNTTQNPGNTYPASGTYSVMLQVTSAQGCISSITNTVLVNPNPVVSFSVTNNCTGSNFSFVNNSTISPGSITQSNWSFGDGGNSSLTTPQHIYSPAGTYLVTLTETSNKGCVSSANQNIIAYPKPVINFSAGAVCQLQPSVFNNTSTITSGSISSFNWDFTSDGVIDNSTQNPNYTYSQGGNFNCTLHAVSDMGCKDSLTKIVTVYLNPIANFNSPAVCLGSPTPFTDASTSQNGTINGWAWDYTSNGTFDSNLQSANTIYPYAATYSVTLQVTSSMGCFGSATQTVVVNPKPNSLFSVNNACVGSVFAFTNTSTISNGNIVQSLWNFGDGTNSSQTAPPHTYANATTYTIILTETSNFGCVSTYTQNVVAYPKPVVNFSAIPVCQLQATIFNNTSTIPSGNVPSYGWDFTSNGTIDNTIQNTSNVYPQGGNFLCTLHAISDKGCVDSATKTVVVYYNPVANFTAPSSCYTQAMQFTNTSTSQSGNITIWDWDYTSDGNFDNTLQNPANVYATTGTFLVTLQVQTNYGCMNIIKKSVHVNPAPVAAFAVSQQKGCPDNMCVSMLNNSTLQGGSIAHWLWNFGDNSVSSTQNSPVHCYKTGTYNISLLVISDSGCTSTSTINNAITVYPKPVAGFTYTPGNVDIAEPLVTFVNEAQGASNYLYFISDGFVVTGQASFSHEFTSNNAQIYTVLQVVTNSFGCKDSIEHDIKINPAYTFYIPNAFTPNSDGTNEVFKGTGIGIKNYTMMIFDRWGELIFQSDDLEKGWDGTFKGKGGEKVQEGVYVWKVQLRDETNKEHDFDGTVSVIK